MLSTSFTTYPTGEYSNFLYKNNNQQQIASVCKWIISEAHIRITISRTKGIINGVILIYSAGEI